MPEFLRETFGRYAPIAIPLVRIGGILLAVIIILKLLDSGLKRLRLLIPANSIGVARVEQRAETLRHIIRSVAKGVLGAILLLTISSELGFDIGPILASAGILGLAVGFGAQSLVKDVISGFFILLEDQFGVGDVIRVGEHSGTVEQMSLRATVLRNLEGQVHVIPNGSIQTVTVLTKEWARAVVDVTVAYKESLDEVFQTLGRVGERLYNDWPDRLMERPAILGVEDLSMDGVKIRLIAKTLPLKQWEVMREWRKRIKEEFDRSGIEVPQRGVLSEKGSEKRTHT
jgi:small conductance mechanosensitive channel